MINSLQQLMDRKHLTGLFVVIIVFGAVFWLGNQPTLYIVEQQKLSGAPDFFLEGVQSRSFDTAGNLAQTVTAVSANHYANSKHTLLEAPVIERQESDTVTVASGKTGKVIDETKSFSLQGSASIVRYQNNSEVVRVEASTLVYNDATQSIQGNKDSKLITATGITQSDSITFDISKDIATLTGGVTGHYEASQH